MMTHYRQLFWMGLMVLSCVRCTVEENLSSQLPVRRMDGQDCQTFLLPSGERSTEGTATHLEEDSRLSLFATGGLSCNEGVFTLHDGQWKGEGTPLKWTSEETASLHAYTPPLPDSAAEFYDNSYRLIDRMVCVQEVPYSPTLHLQFTHLFARLELQVEERLNAQLQTLHVTPGLRVTALHPWDGSLRLSDDDLPTVSFPRSEDGKYRLLLPFGAPLALQLRVELKGGPLLQGATSAFSYESGHHYTCALNCGRELTGIYTTEDFIAFTHLINGEAYGDRQLSEFGATDADGGTTYRLWNDLSFTAEESGQVMMIGKTGHYFRDGFDGQGHTLTGLTLTNTNGQSYVGLFGAITPSGSVRNLTLQDCQMTFDHTSQKWAGLLCGGNNGLIDGCRLVNCRAIAEKALYLGGIAGANLSVVRNCGVEGTYFRNRNYDNRSSSAGGIASINNRHIHNCYVASSTFIARRMAGICIGAESNAYANELRYVYVYKNLCTPTEGYDFLPLLFHIHPTGSTTFDACLYDEGEAAEDTEGRLAWHYDSDLTYNGQSLEQVLNAATAGERDLYRTWEKTTDPKVPFRCSLPGRAGTGI